MTATPSARIDAIRRRIFGLRAALPTIAITAVAFVIGGLFIAATGRDPLATYQAIWVGSGLDWLRPGASAAERTTSAFALQQTLLLLLPLALLGLAVAIPFRARLFNIGGQGQYLSGSFAAVWVASTMPSLPGPLHIVLAILAGALVGAIWAAISGWLRAVAGTSEVITTIMLNYVAIWVGAALFGIGGPLQNSAEPTQPVSDNVLPSARLPVIWGDAALQGLHAGVLLLPVFLVGAWLLLHRTPFGFEVRAVGANDEAASYAGINVRRRYVAVMALAGGIAGAAGSLDMLGWQYRVATADLQAFQLGFLGIAVALLARNNPIGVALAAFLFAALINGSSVRNLDPTVFPPELAGNLTLLIQAVIVLLISLDLALFRFPKLRRSRRTRRNQEVMA